MKKIIIGIFVLIVCGVIAYPYYLASAFKDRVKDVKTPEQLLQLVDENALKESIALSLKAVLEEQVNQDPMAGMAMAFLEPMTKMVAEIALSPEGLQALLKGASIKQVNEKAKEIEEDTWQWAYFTGFNSYRVATKEIDFNFEKQNGDWILKTVALKANEAQQPSKKSETTTKIHQADGSVKEVKDSDKYSEAKYHQDIISFEQANDEVFLKDFLTSHFFVYAIFDDSLVIHNDFDQLPFNVDYKVEWKQVINGDGKNLVKTELTEEQSKRLAEQSEEFQRLGFGGFQSKVFIEKGVTKEQLASVEGDITFSYPVDWKRFEFDLSDNGETKTIEDISFTVNQTSEHRLKINYAYPTEYHRYEPIIMVFDGEGKRLESDGKGGMSMKGKQQVSGKKEIVFYGDAESIVLLFPTKYEQFTEKINANLAPKAESIGQLGEINIERYAEKKGGELLFEEVAPESLRRSVIISAERNSGWRFNRPQLRLDTPRPISNNKHAILDKSQLKAIDSTSTVVDRPLEHSYSESGFMVSANKDLDIEKFSGRVVLDYPVKVSTKRYVNGDEVSGLDWYPSAISLDESKLAGWLQVRGYNKDGMELKQVDGAIPLNWDNKEYVFWGNLAYLEVDIVSKREKIAFDIDHKVPELLDEKCKESNDC